MAVRGEHLAALLLDDAAERVEVDAEREAAPVQRQLRRSPRPHLALLDLALVGGQQQEPRPEQPPGVAQRRDRAHGQEEPAVAESLAVALENAVERGVAVVGQRDGPRLVAQLEARQQIGILSLQVLGAVRVQAERGLDELLSLDPEEVLRQGVEEVARHREHGVRRLPRAQRLAGGLQDELAAALRVEGGEVDEPARGERGEGRLAPPGGDVGLGQVRHHAAHAQRRELRHRRLQRERATP